MRVRETSIEAYNYIVSSGKLATRMRDAYKVFYHAGPLTGQELNARMEGDGAWKLCAELKARNVLIEVGERACSVTGRNAIIWDVTANMPIQPVKVKTKTKKEKISEVIGELNQLYKENTDPSYRGRLENIAQMVNRI